MNFANLSSVADERHNGVKLPVLLKIFNKQEFVSMFEYIAYSNMELIMVALIILPPI